MGPQDLWRPPIRPSVSFIRHLFRAEAIPIALMTMMRARLEPEAQPTNRKGVAPFPSHETRSIFYKGHRKMETTVWGGRLWTRFCNMFSESSTGRWAELQLPCCPRKQGEFPENMLQNLFLHNL